MPSSYGVPFDHIAKILHFLSDAPSFWFSLYTSYDHGCHLSRRFGMSSHEYESLLVAANLAHYSKSIFTIKPKQWTSFLNGHRFTSTEGNDERKIELDKKQFDIDAHIKDQRAATSI